MNDLLGGRYRLVTPLGRGGMGMVYEAVQENLGRRVAVKLLDARLSDDREQLERFRREAEVVASLGHPNIVQVTDFQYPDQLGQQPFLVMELLRGESFGSLVERERLPAARVAFIAAQVLSALVAAHRAGVVHRDIKPDNIFLLADAAVPDTVKVLDFGIAKLSVEGQAKLTGTGAMLGTPAFMAPEQARGESDVDARADIYAVGATMYQALTGRLPYEAASIPALLFAIVEKTPPPIGELRPDLPSDFVAVIERAMAKDRAARFPDADSMRRALAPWSGLPASVRPPVSATAATISSDRMVPHDPATPIVVHHTPAPKHTAAATAPPAKSGPSVLVLLTVVLVVGMLATATVITAAILKKEKDHADDRAQAAASGAPPIAVAASSSGATVTVGDQVHVTVGGATSAEPAVSVALVASASPPAPKAKRYGGTHGHASGGDFGECKGCEWEAFNAELRKRDAAVSACFKASEHEPPLHEHPYYEVHVDAGGNYTAFGPTAAEFATPKLDRCLQGVVYGIKLTKTSGAAGSFKVGFSGECTSGWNGKCD